MKIATINDVNQTFNVSISGNGLKCVTKSFLQSEDATFVVNGDCADNQLVKLSAISRQSGRLLWGFGSNFGDATYVNTVGGWFQLYDESGNEVAYYDISCPPNDGRGDLMGEELSFSQLKSNETYSLSFYLEGPYYDGETCPEAIGIYIGSYDDFLTDQHPSLVLVEKLSYDYLEYPDGSSYDGAVEFSANTSFKISDLISTTADVYDACIVLVMLSDINDSW